MMMAAGGGSPAIQDDAVVIANWKCTRGARRVHDFWGSACTPPLLPHTHHHHCRGFSKQPVVAKAPESGSIFDMGADLKKIDDAVLALLWLGRFRMDKKLPLWSSWKNHDWDALNRLHEAGLIENARNKNKSVMFTAEGARKAEVLFEQLFGGG
jgi:hypothetical protein